MFTYTKTEVASGATNLRFLFNILRQKLIDAGVTVNSPASETHINVTLRENGHIHWSHYEYNYGNPYRRFQGAICTGYDPAQPDYSNQPGKVGLTYGRTFSPQINRDDIKYPLNVHIFIRKDKTGFYAYIEIGTRLIAICGDAPTLYDKPTDYIDGATPILSGSNRFGPLYGGSTGSGESGATGIAKYVGSRPDGWHGYVYRDASRNRIMSEQWGNLSLGLNPLTNGVRLFSPCPFGLTGVDNKTRNLGIWSGMYLYNSSGEVEKPGDRISIGNRHFRVMRGTAFEVEATE